MSKKKLRHTIAKKVGGQHVDPQPISATRGTLIVGASVGLTLFSYFIFSAFPAVINIFSLATAAVAGFTLNILGLEVSRHGTILAMSAFSFQLIPDCTPLPPVLLLSGAMLAFPAYWKAKATGIGLGILILSALNLVRIVSLVYIGLYLPQWLDIAHNVIWQSAMILAGILIWLFWLKSRMQRKYA